MMGLSNRDLLAICACAIHGGNRGSFSENDVNLSCNIAEAVIKEASERALKADTEALKDHSSMRTVEDLSEAEAKTLKELNRLASAMGIPDPFAQKTT